MTGTRGSNNSISKKILLYLFLVSNVLCAYNSNHLRFLLICQERLGILTQHYVESWENCAETRNKQLSHARSPFSSALSLCHRLLPLLSFTPDSKRTSFQIISTIVFQSYITPGRTSRLHGPLNVFWLGALD